MKYKKSTLVAILLTLVAMNSQTIAHADACKSNSNSPCPITSTAQNSGRQEVQNGAGISQKQALQNSNQTNTTTPAPSSSSGAKNSNQNNSMKTRRDWSTKSSMNCVKGSMTLHLKNVSSCPKGFTKA